MKLIKCFFAVLILLLNVQFISAQDVPDAPEPPVVLPKAEKYSPYWDFTEQEEQAYLKDLDAELKLKLQEIKKHDQEKYAEYLRELHWRRMENHFMVRGMEKERMALERKITESEIRTEALAIKYQKSPSEEIKRELAKNVGELFDQKEKVRKWEVDMLESEIEKLKQKIANRQKSRDIIIRRRVEELLGVEEDLEWD